MDTAVKSILLNKELIAIDQDVLGSQATAIVDANGWVVYKKELSNDRYAICILNRGNATAAFSFSLETALKVHGQWNAREIFSNRQLRTVKTLAGELAAHDCSIFILNPANALRK
jgi:alpha-galactosidase